MSKRVVELLTTILNIQETIEEAIKKGEDTITYSGVHCNFDNAPIWEGLYEINDCRVLMDDFVNDLANIAYKEQQRKYKLEKLANLILDCIEDYKTAFGVKKVNTYSKKFKAFFEEWKSSN